MNITESNLISLTAAPKPGQRVIQLAPGKWIPVGLGGITPSGSSNSTSQFLAVEAGYIDANGNFQPLSFNGTQASDSGSAIQGLQHKIFNTGHDEPDYGGSGGAVQFYKCASVDTSNSTWTGYKAVFDAVSGTYSFEATATSGLTYGNGINPQVGGVYNSDATIAATLYQGDSLNIPGLVFYAPLSSLAAYAITGQEISGSADAYATVQGIPCARFSSLAAYLSASDSALPHGNVPVTVSCWLNYSVIPSDFSGIFYYGNSQSFGQSIAFPDWNSVLFSGANGVNALTDVTPSTGTWYHFLSIYDGNGTITNYVNGVVSGQPWSSTLNIGTGNIQIAPTEVSRDIYMASARIYNRALTAAEVAALAAEFTPTT